MRETTPDPENGPEAGASPAPDSGSAHPAGSQRSCAHCGNPLNGQAVFCTECERYQPDPGTGGGGRQTVPCRFCAEWIPANAARCNHCDTFQRGYRSVLPVSAATVSALAALVSLLILLFNTWNDRPADSVSQTRVDLVRASADGRELVARLTNRGNVPSFVSTAWMKVGYGCDWSEESPPPFCDAGMPASPKGSPPPGESTQPESVLQLDASPAGEIAPGVDVVSFRINGTLRATERPEPRDSWCGGEADFSPLSLCVAFQVLEHQEEEPVCQYREVSDIQPRHFQPLVEKVLCG